MPTSGDGGNLETAVVAGLQIVATSPSDAAQTLLSAAQDANSAGVYDVHLVNAYTVALADQDERLAEVLNNAWCNFPDGKPVSWLGKRRHPRLEQVRGPRLFHETLSAGQIMGARHYFYGAAPNTLDALIQRVKRQFPRAVIAGYESPPFRDLSPDEFQAVCARIERSEANIVWVGLGTPKQDFASQAIASEVPAITVAIGAAFDFMAGTQPEAPMWMRAIGLEWTFRFASEPRRLWRRYTFGNLRFLKVALLQPFLRRFEWSKHRRT